MYELILKKMHWKWPNLGLHLVRQCAISIAQSYSYGSYLSDHIYTKEFKIKILFWFRVELRTNKPRNAEPGSKKTVESVIGPACGNREPINQIIISPSVCFVKAVNI